MEYINTNVIDQSIMQLGTEQRNANTINIAMVSTEEMLHMINREDHTVAANVEKAIPEIARAADILTERMKKGGRLVYIGCGTSARIAFADAAECPPTYHVKDDIVTCLMAGGRECVFHAKEGKEDSESDAEKDLIAFGLTSLDTVVSATTSGRTPYCIAGLKYAAKIGAGRISIACNRPSQISVYAEVAIDVETGAEVIMGSTRMKAGTAEKLIMNMLSTTVMVKLGRTFSNLLITGEPDNEKVNNRAPRRFAEVTGNPDLAYAVDRIKEVNGCLRCAVVRELTKCSITIAKKACDESDGNIMSAIHLAEQFLRNV